MLVEFDGNNLKGECKGIFHLKVEIMIYDKECAPVIFNWSNEIFLYGSKFDAIDCVVFHM